MAEIAVIGYGRFGRLASLHLKKSFMVCVADRRKIFRVAPGIDRVSIEVAASKKNIVLAVPINQLQSVLKTISPLVRPGTLICDVCSVKIHPVQWMRKILPDYVSILGTHPLFGPDSAAHTLHGRTVLLCPVRISSTKLGKIRKLLTASGMLVYQMTPQRHDRLMASSLFLTQFVSRALVELKLPRASISTANFKVLSRLASTASNDSLELFRDMYRFNPYARTIPKEVLRAFQALDRSLTRSR